MLSNNFSNKEIFERSKQDYEEALKNIGIGREVIHKEGEIDLEKFYVLIPPITWK